MLSTKDLKLGGYSFNSDENDQFEFLQSPKEI